MAELDTDKTPTSHRRTERLAPPSAPMLTEDPFAEPAPTAPVESPIPMLDDAPDDIPDPEVPADLVEAILTDPIAPKTVQDAPGDAQTQTGPLVPVETPSGVLRPEWRQFEPLLQGLLSYLGKQLTDEQARVLDEIKASYREFDRSISATWEVLKKLVDQAGQANEHALYSLAESLRLLSQQGMPLRHDPYTATVKAFTPQGFPVEITMRKSEPEELITSLPFLAQWMADNGYKPIID